MESLAEINSISQLAYQKASENAQKCVEYSRKESEYKRISVIINLQLSKQLQVNKSFQDCLDTRINHFSKEVNDLLSEYKQVMENFEKVIRELSTQRVPDGTTLYDWAAIRDICESQSEAKVEIGEMEKLFRFINYSLKLVRTLHWEISKRHEAVKQLYNKEIAQNETKYLEAKFQEDLIAKCKDDISIKLEVLKIDNSATITNEELIDFRAKLKTIEEGTKDIDFIVQEAQKKAEKYQEFFQSCHVVNELLRYFLYEIHERNKRIDSLSSKYKYHCLGYKEFFRKLKSSTVFYQQSLKAYEHMHDVEIPRRIIANTEMQNLIDEFENKIEELKNKEIEKRREFDRNYSKLLPEGIAPGIQEELPDIKVIPNRIQTEFYCNVLKISFDDNLSLSQDIDDFSLQEGEGADFST